MKRIQHFFQLHSLRWAYSREVAQLERELTESEGRVVALRAEQLLDRNRLARLNRERSDLDREFRDAMQEGDSSAALESSTKASRVVERIAELHEQKHDLRVRLLRALETREWIKRKRTRVCLEKAAATRRLSDLLWGAGPASRQAAAE